MTARRYRPPREQFAEWMNKRYGFQDSADAAKEVSTAEPSNNSYPKISCAPASIPYNEALTPAEAFTEALSRAGIGTGYAWGPADPWMRIL